MNRSVVISRIAAGVIVPVASCFIWGLSETVSAASPMVDMAFLGLGLVLGAPLAVPISLAMAPRRLWFALPAISIAAAVGIAVQLPVLFSSQSADILVVFWGVPAIFGAGVAYFLRWCDRPVADAGVAVMALIVLAAIAFLERPAPEDPNYSAKARTWSELRAGMTVYTGGDNDSATQTVCVSLSTYLQYERSGKSSHCMHVAHGVPVVVESIIPCSKSDPTFGYETPAARVRSIDGSWRGTTTAANFQPNIATGTILKMERDWGAPLSMLRDGRYINLGDAATVKLLRYDPKADPGRTLFVRVLDGAHTGEEGWAGIQDVDSGNAALGEYEMAYPTRDCF